MWRRSQIRKFKWYIVGWIWCWQKVRHTSKYSRGNFSSTKVEVCKWYLMIASSWYFFTFYIQTSISCGPSIGIDHSLKPSWHAPNKALQPLIWNCLPNSIQSKLQGSHVPNPTPSFTKLVLHVQPKVFDCVQIRWLSGPLDRFHPIKGSVLLGISLVPRCTILHYCCPPIYFTEPVPE